MGARTVACFKDLGVGVEEGMVPVTSEKARPCRGKQATLGAPARVLLRQETDMIRFLFTRQPLWLQGRE